MRAWSHFHYTVYGKSKLPYTTTEIAMTALFSLNSWVGPHWFISTEFNCILHQTLPPAFIQIQESLLQMPSYSLQPSNTAGL